MAPNPLRKEGLIKLCRKSFGQECWLDDVYRLCKCYAYINSARSAWSKLMILLYSTAFNPTQQNDWYLCPFSPLLLVINLPEVISTSHKFFDRPVWHHKIWNGAIWLELLKLRQRQTFSIQFFQNLFLRSPLGPYILLVALVCIGSNVQWLFRNLKCSPVML